jgi:hypothetical protein
MTNETKPVEITERINEAQPRLRFSSLEAKTPAQRRREQQEAFRQARAALASIDT